MRTINIFIILFFLTSCLVAQEFTKVAMPSKNFNLLGQTTFTDPKDGKVKIALHTYSASKCGMLVIIDPDDLTGESYETPGDFGAWALCQYDGSLLIGTCPKDALIYNFDLMSRTFKGDPAKAPGVTYIWTLERASDGFVYGGTYAGCRLMRYDPTSHTITDLGRVDPDENNWYSRNVHCNVAGKLFIDCGYSTKRIFTYDLQTNTFSQFHKDGYQVSALTDDFVCVVSDTYAYKLLDPHTGNKLYDRPFQMNEMEALSQNHPIFEKLFEVVNKLQDPRIASLRLPNAYPLANGDIVGFQGQEIYKLKKSAMEPEFHPYPVAPPSTCAFGISVDEEGKIWGTSSFGMTAFCYDPKTGETVNTLDLSRSGGECYGVIPYGGKIYFTAYSAGEHIVYDPKAPWDMRANINPKMVYTVSPDYIRPHTRSVTNGDGVIWTGWMAKYGAYGSAITKWDVKSGEITLFDDLIGENSIEALTIYKESVLFTTAKSGNGLPSVNDAPKYICKMTSDGKITHQIEVDKSPGSLCVNGDGGVISMGQDLCLLNPETLELIPLGITLPGAQIRKYKDHIIAVAKANCYIIDQNKGNVLLKTGGTGADIHDVCVNGNDVWAAGNDGWIYRMTVEADVQTNEKQKAFEWVFGDLVKFDREMVRKVLNDTHGKRHYVDKDGDGKPEEVWFVDISPRHRTDNRPVLVRAIDINGNLHMGKEPGYAGYLYIADWNADGTVDGAVEYIDSDSDGDIDEMAIFFYNPWISKGLSVWWGRDDGDDNLLWYDIDYVYDQRFCQDRTHFGGDETFSLFGILPGEKYWTPKIEIPFLFYDHDGDGITEEVICVFGQDTTLYALRHSFDLDNDATPDSPRDFDVSMSAYAPGWTFGEHGMGNAFELILDPNKGNSYHLRPNAGQSETLTIHGIPALPIIKRKVAQSFFKDIVWSRVLMTWDEIDLNIGDGSDFERWEGVIPSSSTDEGFEFPAIGGPPCGPFNKRYELVLNPVSANEYYFSPSDSRIHIKHSDRTWLKVDYDYDQKVDMVYLWTDTNKDGILDKIEVDIDGDGKFDDVWTLDVSAVQTVQWNFWALNKVFAPVIVNETPLVYQLNRVVEKATKTVHPNAEKAPAWKMIETKMRTEKLSKDLSERLLNSDASMLYYMRIATDYEIAVLKKAYKNKSFWQKFDVARGRNDIPEMIRILCETFKLSPVSEQYAEWMKDLRRKPAPDKRTSWDNTWFPPNWGWESEKAAFRFYDGHFDLFGKRIDTLIYPAAVKSGANYHKEQPWGMDILHVDKTGGCGGLTLYVDDVAYPVRREVAGDPVFTGQLLKETSDTVSLVFTATGVGPTDAPYTVYIKVSAMAGTYDSPIEVRVEGENGHLLKLGIGLNRLTTEHYFMDKRLGIMGVWGFQDPEIGWIGTGVLFPAERYLYLDEQPDEHRVVLKYDAGELIRYHIRGDWLRAHPFPVAPGMREWRETLTKTTINHE